MRFHVGVRAIYKLQKNMHKHVASASLLFNVPEDNRTINANWGAPGERPIAELNYFRCFLKKSTVRSHASSAAALSYRGVVSL